MFKKCYGGPRSGSPLQAPIYLKTGLDGCETGVEDGHEAWTELGIGDDPGLEI